MASVFTDLATALIDPLIKPPKGIPFDTCETLVVRADCLTSLLYQLMH